MGETSYGLAARWRQSMRIIKFRAWIPKKHSFGKRSTDQLHVGFSFQDIYSGQDEANVFCDDGSTIEEPKWDKITLEQFTGLKDKNGSTEVYEGDILGEDGLIKGNKHENADLLQDETNILIEGFGTKAWLSTYQKAVDRGCENSK